MPGQRILIVEDEFLNAAYYEAAALELGYEVCGIVDTAEAAVAAAAEKRPDLILMDIRLRGPLDGVWAATQIRRTSDTPILYLTAHVDPATQERAAGTRPVGFLSKPVMVEALQAGLSRAFGEAA
ncbi:MAG TPA: response regulator [Alphaproteobacteria bacterium]|nr:response regulator [Alphaproteobacteria bacterium]